jgi:MFS family permease
VPLQLHDVRGFRAVKIGVILTPSAIATALSMAIGGRLVDRMGARRPIVTGCLLMMIGAAGNAFISPHTSLAWIATSLAIQGIGVGIVMIPATVAGLNAIADHAMAHASTIRSLTNQVGAAMSVAVMFALVNARLASATTAQQTQRAYNSVFIVAIVALAVASLVALRLPATGSRPTIQAKGESWDVSTDAMS